MADSPSSLQPIAGLSIDIVSPLEQVDFIAGDNAGSVVVVNLLRRGGDTSDG